MQTNWMYYRTCHNQLRTSGRLIAYKLKGWGFIQAYIFNHFIILIYQTYSIAFKILMWLIEVKLDAVLWLYA